MSRKRVTIAKTIPAMDVLGKPEPCSPFVPFVEFPPPPKLEPDPESETDPELEIDPGEEAPARVVEDIPVYETESIHNICNSEGQSWSPGWSD